MATEGNFQNDLTLLLFSQLANFRAPTKYSMWPWRLPIRILSFDLQLPRKI